MTATTPTDPAVSEEALRARYRSVLARIAEAARAAGGGRKPEDIVLVAVTKHAEPDQIRALMRLGHRDFGENRVQHLIQRAAMVEEFLSRQRVLPHAREESAARSGGGGADLVRWHMIGHLQRNKVRKAVEFCRLIQSVDSLRLAEEIQQVAVKRERPVDVLVQVNCAGEATKFGCPLPAALHLAEQIDTMVFVRVRGLMTMAPLIEDPAASRRAARDCFARCRELFEEIRTAGLAEGRFNILSMGMSADFELAIAEGANMVRVGSAIFGEPRHPIPDEPEEGD